LQQAQQLVRDFLSSMHASQVVKLVTPAANNAAGPTEGHFFFAVDNTCRASNGRAGAPFAEIRRKLDDVVQSDPRKIQGLGGRLTPYLDFCMPLNCLLLLKVLKRDHGRVCSRVQHVEPMAESLGILTSDIAHLLRVLAELGVINYFPHIAEDLVILDPQWIMDSMVRAKRASNVVVQRG
jgi:hypothetical protein